MHLTIIILFCIVQCSLKSYQNRFTHIGFNEIYRLHITVQRAADRHKTDILRKTSLIPPSPLYGYFSETWHRFFQIVFRYYVFVS